MLTRSAGNAPQVNMLWPPPAWSPMLASATRPHKSTNNMLIEASWDGSNANNHSSNSMDMGSTAEALTSGVLFAPQVCHEESTPATFAAAAARGFARANLSARSSRRRAFLAAASAATALALALSERASASWVRRSSCSTFLAARLLDSMNAVFFLKSSASAARSCSSRPCAREFAKWQCSDAARRWSCSSALRRRDSRAWTNSCFWNSSFFNSLTSKRRPSISRRCFFSASSSSSRSSSSWALRNSSKPPMRACVMRCSMSMTSSMQICSCAFTLTRSWPCEASGGSGAKGASGPRLFEAPWLVFSGAAAADEAVAAETALPGGAAGFACSSCLAGCSAPSAVARSLRSRTGGAAATCSATAAPPVFASTLSVPACSAGPSAWRTAASASAQQLRPQCRNIKAELRPHSPCAAQSPQYGFRSSVTVDPDTSAAAAADKTSTGKCQRAMG
mmetsp:Transcript_39350/g.113916  ORF Transcript_39350/g.113916 Transcript_39350/m.113916 type:complete len:450 (+) Transcript_39350:357-1706(+)